MSKQIVTYGNNDPQSAFYPVVSRTVYDCANSSISRGVTGIPQSIVECFKRFPGIMEIAEAVGFFNPDAATYGSGSSGGGTLKNRKTYTGGGYTLWTGLSGDPPDINLLNTFAPVDMYFNNKSDECAQIGTMFNGDTQWFGCLWGTPEASYSCTCPEIGSKYEAYIKHRLNVASFWNTPVETPVKRTEFVDATATRRVPFVASIEAPAGAPETIITGVAAVCPYRATV